jgi:hypothetical protein
MPAKKSKSFQIPLDVPVSHPHSQTHYLGSEPVLEVVPVPEVAPVVEVAEVVPVVPVVEVKKEKKPRKPKKVVEVITDSDSEPDIKQPEPEPQPKLKKSNAWVQHIRAFALENGIGYNKAMIHPDLKKNYIKSTGGRVSL